MFKSITTHAIALVCVFMTVGASARDWKDDLQDKLRALYPVPKRGTPPAPVAVLQAGANAICVPTFNFGIPPTYIKDHLITNPASSPTLQVGQRVFITSFDVQDEQQIRIRVTTDNTSSDACRATLFFQFEKGSLRSANLDTLKKAIDAILASDPQVLARTPQPPPPPPPPPPLRNADLRVGDPAPDFSFVDANSRAYQRADYDGKAVVIVWFSPTISYRGAGSFYQISECQGLRDASAYLEALNVAYFMVSLSSPQNNQAFVSQSCAGVNFPVLSDSTGQSAAAYGVLKSETGIDPSAVLGPGAGQVPRGWFVFGSITYIGEKGTILYKEELENIRLQGFGRNVADRLRQLGVRTKAELSAAPPTPKTVELGQTPEQVEQILGKPDTIAKLGTKTIYSFKALKVIFTNDKVTDVQ